MDSFGALGGGSNFGGGGDAGDSGFGRESDPAEGDLVQRLINATPPP